MIFILFVKFCSEIKKFCGKIRKFCSAPVFVARYRKLDYRSGPNTANDFCNCTNFLAKRFCKHSLATKVDKGLIEPPKVKSLENLFQKSSVGKPKKVGGTK